MNQKQMNPGKAFRTRLLPFLIAAVLLISGAVAFAVLRDTTSGVQNKFTAATVSCKVDETFDGNTKSDVKITNIQSSTNVPALVRAKVVINWVDDNGNILAQPPASDGYVMEASDDFSTYWSLGTDGYYYYKGIVPVGESTSLLFKSIKPKDGAQHKLQVEIVAEAIQAAPAIAAGEAWGYMFSNGSWQAYVAPSTAAAQEP